MLSAIQLFYEHLDEPNKSCLWFLRGHILKYDTRLTGEWKYRLPFFYFNGKMFCYFWMDSVTKALYIGFMNGNRMCHPALESGLRKRVKIYPLNAEKDLNLAEIDALLYEAMAVM